MSDTINRKAAIDAILGLTNCDTTKELRTYVKGHDLGSWWSGGVLSSIGKVERLPSAEKTGRWTYTDGKPATIGASYCVICDQCGEESEYCTRFCPNCGADMRGGDA